MAYGTQRGADIIIATGESASNGIDLWGMQLVGLDMPSAWTAAAVAFQVARSTTETEMETDGNSAYRDLYDKTQRVILTVAASQRVVFDADTIAKFQGVRHLKVVSVDGSTGAAVTQEAARTIVPLVGQTLNA